ncbi:MAG: DUF924 domain-containing protein [Gammaproteobacteria bacterium]|nr:DUF924 domain-containing protein [Gammaproteobacteria bacterium]
MGTKPNEILQFWFDDVVEKPERLAERNKFWFQSSPEIDGVIEERFKADVEAAANGQYDDWGKDAHDSLAFIILLDQFPRNFYRGTAQAFAHDSIALARCQEMIASNRLKGLQPIERSFALMPLQHSEDLDVQKQSVQCFSDLTQEAPAAFKQTLDNNYQFARDHLEIIEKFGRFPHRNAILGRESTEKELNYLTSGGKTFGQG